MTGLLGAAALLLLAAGLPKVWDPAPGRRALSAARLPSGAALVRLGGLAEVALALTVLLVGGRPAAAAVGLGFGVLAVFAWRMATVAPGAACGCFGASSAPVGRWHVGTDVVLSGCGLAAVVHPAPGLLGALGPQPLLGLPLLLLVGLLAWACYLLMTALPTLLSAAAR